MSQCIGIDLGETHTRVAIQSGGVTAASCAAQMDVGNCSTRSCPPFHMPVLR